MIAYIIRRLFVLVPTLLGVSILVFLMLHLTPGDPAELLMGERASEEALQEIREHLGLNKPLHEQYWLFLKQLMQGDLGETIWTRQKVWIEVKQRFPATIELSIVALLISCFAGMILCIISATKQYSIFDYLSMLGALVGVSMPIFWLGLVFMLIFALNLGWLPMSGRLSVGVEIETITNVNGEQTACVNPGTVGGVGTSPATWILADLDTMTFEVHEVDKAIEFRTATAS